jgi:hypothetical protein
MLNGIITASLRHRLLVLLLSAVLVALGASAAARLSIDAFPDTTPVQVQINTEAGALNPLEVEQQITQFVELAIGGLPGLENVRSVSKFGFSQVVATFDDEVGVYLARQLVAERLASVELPEGIDRPQLGPIATGLGEVFHYLVTSDDPHRTLTSLRELQDWVVKPELRKVRGVAEINSWGGFEKQFHVVVEPERLLKYGLTFQDVFAALEAGNRNVGGGQIVSGGGGRPRSRPRPHDDGRRDRRHRRRDPPRHAGAHRGPRERPDRPRDPPRRRDGRREGRAGPGPGVHAHGREQPRRDARAEGAARDRPVRAPEGRTSRRGLRAHRPRGQGHQTVEHNLIAGGDPRRRGALRVPGRPARRAHRGLRDPALDALRGEPSCSRPGSPPAYSAWAPSTSASSWTAP